MSEWVAQNTMLVLLCIAGSATAVVAVWTLLRSRWLDEYGNPKNNNGE
jgi:hypothetical protein